MNLRVDLIFETEQRSGSLLSPKSLIRIGTIVGPAILALLVAVFVMQVWQLNSKLTLLEGQWESLGKKKKESERLRDQLLTNRKILDEIGGWRASHMDWHTQMRGIMTEVPAEIELKRLQVSQRFDVLGKDMPARMFTMTVSGRAVGSGAETAVEQLRSRIQSSSVFATNIAENGVTVSAYGADTTVGANKRDRVFTITSQYEARKFDRETARR